MLSWFRQFCNILFYNILGNVQRVIREYEAVGFDWAFAISFHSEDNPSDPACALPAHLRAKSRLRRLRSETRLRAQPLHKEALVHRIQSNFFDTLRPRSGPKPPSDEGGGFCEAKDGGREQLPLSQKSKIFASSPDKGSPACRKTGHCAPARRLVRQSPNFLGRFSSQFTSIWGIPTPMCALARNDQRLF